MNEEQLTKLIRAADDLACTEAGVPRDASGAARYVDRLEAQVTRRRTNRRRVAMAGAGVAVVAVLAVLPWVVGNGEAVVARQKASDPDGTNASVRSARVAEAPVAEAPAIDVEALRAELVALHAEAEHRLQIVTALRQAETTMQMEAEVARLEREVGPSPVLRAELAFEREVDRTAIIRLAFADRLVDEVGDQEAAADEYRCVAEQFPNTLWATTANNRLAEFDAM